MLQVVVGVVINAKKEILIAERKQGKHEGGKWEFPGGKVEENETKAQALIRELKEELGIVVQQSRYLFSVEHEYPQRKIALSIYEVSQFSGEPQGLEGQAIQWVPFVRLLDYPFPEANQEILLKLKSY